METFVERIIETDRKAQEVIGAAQKEKKELLQQARERARQELAQREAAARQGKQAVDAEMEQSARQASQSADEDYLEKKRALDAAFEAHREAWLSEITSAILNRA